MLRILLILVAAFVAHGTTLATEQSGGEMSYRIESDISYLDAEEPATAYQQERCRLDVYAPVNKTRFATVVWFHGGGLKAGKRSIPAGLKNRGIAVVAANYRLFPEVKCPAYLQDAAGAVAWTVRNIHRYGGDAGQIFVSGHSAGGYLTSMIGIDKRWLAAILDRSATGVENDNCVKS